ncbi:DnaT-like ssDNA-binding protein [Ancylobacter sp. VNQ12]|uniref:DnaT-like ssDNA-binding protein n=1 Tax=Ancylobacter sp. VNQ12 TaxID=3400920 RepID=UPI003C129D70
MALIVEDGTGKADAESYVSVSDCAAYALAHGWAFDPEPEYAAEQALRRATTWIDATYRSRFTGRRTNGRKQALEWPRVDAHDKQCPPDYIESDEVPQEIVDACCEAAIRERAEPGLLSPDLERGGDVRRLKAGSVEVEFGASASVGTKFSAIDNVLVGLLTAYSPYSGRAVRA